MLGHIMSAYLEHRRQFMATADSINAAFCYFSPLNILSKLALGKMTDQEVNGLCVLQNGEGAAFVMYNGDTEAYFATILLMLEQKREVRLVPEFIANHLKGQYKVETGVREYMSSTPLIQNLDRPRLKSLRSDIRRAQRHSAITPYKPPLEAELLSLNAAWYAEAKTRHFRPYDKTSIDWLLKNWAEVTELAPDARGWVCRETFSKRAVAFSLTCDVSDQSWHCFTRRYIRDTQVPSPNMYAWVVAAEAQTKPICNDGTADSKEIRQAKDRYTEYHQTSYRVSPHV